MNHLLLLKSLLFMNFGQQIFIDYATSHCIAVNTGSLLGRCNRVCNFADINEQDIIEIKNYFGATHFTWAVDNTDSGTINLLEKNGLVHKATSPGMIINLDELKLHPIADQIDIKEIQSEDDFILWISLTCSNYGYNKSELSNAIRFLINRAQGMLKLYIGYYQGNPVAAGMIAYHQDNFVSMHLVGTLKEYRNKGLGMAILTKPLLNAYAQGYQKAILMSSEMGLSLALKLGFKQYCTLNIYGNY